ncbi:MAG: Phosphorylated carbohydrates phosphatase [Verrucomicrobiae bacterium]|nr:Phosphorylated carbohydrates phosphatase [Verrucomicrobiae bacterium]
MDGVLCDSEDFMAEAGAAMFAETYGVQVALDEFRPFRGTGEDRYLGGVAQAHGIAINLPADKNRAYAIFLKHIKGRLKPLPGALDFTLACRQRGLKTAIATSADRMKLDGMLPEIGLPRERFDAIVTGSDITHKKPDPEIFLTAAKLIGLPASDCLVVEDAGSGVQAAKAAGSRCLALMTSLDGATLRGLGADWIAPNLAAVPAEIWGS